MDKSWSSSKKASFFFYLIFLAASVWASGESLARTLETSKILCYTLAFAGLATASFCLNLLKQSASRGYISNRTTKAAFGFVGFLFLWFCILMANTHNIYYIMTINKLRQKELRNLKNQFELVQNQGISTLNTGKAKFTSKVESEIENLKNEIQNPNNLGQGAKTDIILNRIEHLLGSEVDMLTNPPSDRNGLRSYATAMSEKIRSIKDQKLRIIDEKIKQLEMFFEQKEFKTTNERIEFLIQNYEDSSERDIIVGLRNGYSTYQKCQEYFNSLFNEPFIKQNTSSKIQSLPEVPESIEMDDISYSWGKFSQGELNTSRFIWSIVIALVLDLACFLFWYFGVLADED
ncbi:hypothetical protein LZD49_32260 [Dyadobacter sp. CY261]|uniref:hypothetical protein n=1 Tax=Dyadobacter sp. CY261 TaxID=2907203 RepID=UPI001F3F7830|nr:hypothetical protein [Dyadobacter sp. CY261]MCF0075201.1 hypothetical protein [Dyadobacter sp. CY261]